jgi:tetratricopeptide (TPR) repeat protein
LRPFGYASTNHLQAALELINRGDLPAAEAEARMALNDPGTRAAGWATLGVIRVQQRKYDEGAEFLQKALRIDSRLVGARINLGGVYVLQGKKDQAREMFSQALRLDPANRNARLDLAQLESDAGNYQAALDAAEPISGELRHSPEGIALLAGDYAGLHQQEALRALVAQWKALPPDASAASLNFASVLLAAGCAPEAIEVLERAKGAGPVTDCLDQLLADGYLAAGSFDRASQAYEAALVLNPDCLACLRGIATVSVKQGNTEKALAYLIRAKRVAPEDPGVLFEFGKVCLQRDLVDDALSAFQEAVKLRPDNDSFRYLLASAHIGKEQYSEARELIVALLKKHPDDPQLNYAAGAAFYLEDRLEDADHYLRKSITLQPRQVGSYDYLGRVAARRGDAGQAAEIFHNLVRDHPEYAPGYEGLGEALLKQRQYPDAQSALERAILLEPNSTAAHYQLGMLLGRIGKNDDSSRELEIARRLESDRRAKENMRLHILMPE